MSIRRTFLACLGLAFTVSAGVFPAAAEELVLKDGRKIVGTIVGYENDMFRVETEYGFALVRKDKVVSVNFAAGGSADTASKRGEAKNRAARTMRGARNPESVAAAPPAEPATDSAAPRALASTPPTPPPPPVSRPLDEPLPSHIEERVEGNNYVNETFQFAMYKPPGWKVFEAVPKETGAAIVAVGTEDEQTLLFVDRQVWSGPPDLKNDHVEARLRQTYQEFQKLGESAVELGGQPAVRRVFKGVLDGVEWYGVTVHVARGNTLFGITGLTSAETFQFQQALFAKIMNSFRFVSPKSNEASGAPAVATP